ncbi:acyl carrier protein [Streptomyces sp. NBC_00076]
MRLAAASLRAAAGTGGLQPVFADLVRVPVRRAAVRHGDAATTAGESGVPVLVRKVAGLDAEERRRALLEEVRENVAAVLGHSGIVAVGATRGFLELGFDSLTAVELRNRMNSLSGMRLPATLIFDYPSPAALADYLDENLPRGGGESEAGVVTAAGPRPGGVVAELDGLEAALAAGALGDDHRTAVRGRLRALLLRLDGEGELAAASIAVKLEEADDDDMFDFIDNELGV